MKPSLDGRLMEGLSQGSPTIVQLPYGGGKARIFWVTLEGPIGTGETELCKVLSPRLQEHFGKDRVFYVAEPIDELMASGLFQDYQRKPKRWAFEFQTTFFDKRTDYFREAYDDMIHALAASPAQENDTEGCKTAIMLSERSIMSDTCFMRVQYACGHCSKETLDRYLRLNSKWRELYRGMVPGLVVYCRAGNNTAGIVELCQKRIRERNREAEQDLVTPEYNAIVLREHDSMFATSARVVVDGFLGEWAIGVPIVIVDTTENYRDDERVAMKKSSELLDHIKANIGEGPHAPASYGPFARLGGAGPINMDPVVVEEK